MKSQFPQVRTFWSKQISGLNFILPVTIVFSHSHTSKAEFELSVCSEQTADFYYLDKTIIPVINSLFILNYNY